ncbi:DUF4340 domain-containing protein [Treponema sp. Marseille-Q4130]|uniref:DUF4340 domain-containing protein n=1 Tax=Treponema sp. Marseille-Q4130 TaxID=2766702 RepID=UPI00165263C3|nr:DUF4340 domain-containing protein [Treponema sp. Marseille-Q4130]MBC6718958.1 DUF4340 domain-containing protein [Treponema sp. Marseille-Q4130]
MSKRKIILLTACVLLLGIYIAQLASSLRSSVKNKTLGADPDKLTIENASAVIELAKSDDGWTVGERRYKADTNTVDALVNAVKNIRVLDTVAQAGSDAVDERYEIDKTNAIVVKAYKGNELVRTLTIGKTSSTGSQSYLTLDGKKDIYLVSGTLRDTFKKDVAALRSKSVYAVDTSDLTAVSESMGSTVLSIVKSGDPAAWTASGGTASVDAEKAANWAASLTRLNADSWLDDDFVLPPVSESVTVITAGGKAITVSVYKEGDGDDAKYYGTCSETPYKFSLSRYSAGKYLKTAADISTKQ